MELPEKIFDIKSSSEEYISALKAQLNKDLAKVGDHQFSANNFEPKRWIIQFSEILVSLKPDELQQLLYVVDLPENWSKQILQSENANEQLAEAILQREWQKIFFRIKFS